MKPHHVIQQLFVLTVCVAGVNSFSMIEPTAIAQSTSVSEESREEALGRAEQLNQRVVELYKQGRYAEATPLAQEALSIREERLGADHPHVATSLNNLAELYKAQGSYAVALPLYERALTISEATLGTEHPAVATSLNNLAALHQIQGNYAAALPLYERALSIFEAALGTDHPHVATSLNNLAELYKAQGNYAAALPLYERAIAISEATLGTDHPAVAQSLNNLAELYRVQGNYAAALPLYERALAIREAALGTGHIDIAQSLNNLAALHQIQGSYAAALPLYERALSIFEAALGTDHPAVATNLNNLAELYKAQGNYAAALPLYERAIAISEATLGTDHPAVATNLNNLALLYQAQGNYTAALPLCKRALAIRETVLGTDHPHVATSLNNLALLYQAQGNYTAALPLYERAIDISEATLRSDHPDVANSLQNLALLYKAQDNYAAALPLGERALAIYEAALGPDHPDAANSLQNLALLYKVQGQTDQALAFLKRASAIAEKNLTDILASASEQRRQHYANTLTGETNIHISLNINEAPANPDATQLAFTTVLRRKGRVLDASADTFRKLRQQLSPADQPLLDELNNIRTQLSNLRYQGLQNRSPEDYQSELKQLETKAEALENNLSRKSKAFRVESEPVTLEAIQPLIPDEAALIEIIRYSPFNFDQPQDQWNAPHYVAYILTQSGPPQVINLGEAETIDQLVTEFSDSLGNKRNNIKSIARQLDARIMAPVRALIGNKTRLLISPDSQLNLIPFDALVDEQDRYLIETYHISYLTSGRDLLRLQLNTPSQQPPVIVANPDYGSSVATKQTASTHRRSVDANSLRNFLPLDGTAEEGDAIARLLPDSTLLTQQQATENALKQLTAPNILHIATHGFFHPDIEFIPPADPNTDPTRNRQASIVVSPIEATAKPTPSNLENPLLRSGLAMAWANTRNSQGEDGILTALEASGLNLLGTQLVVLSACQTGLGSASTGEGVYGLRRSFAIAGAKSQLMSLWLVDDYGTSQLMQQYYQNLIEKSQGRSEALRQAQREMLAADFYKHPYYWASFILSGDWRPIDP